MSARRATRLAPRRHRSWTERGIIAVGITVVLLCLSGAGVMAYVGFRLGQITKYDVALAETPPGAPANFLLVGSDSRDNITDDDPDAGAFLGDGAVPGTGQRSDTIMVLRVDPAAEAAELLSLPRDLWVPIAGTGSRARINSAYGLGRQVLIDTIEEHLDIQINHYVEVDFVAFREIVDEVGGVPLYFDQPVRDAQTGLLVEQPGCHRLDGRSALNFARSRALQYQDADGRWRTDPTGDLGRMTRQQIFIRRAITAGVRGGLTNPVRLNNLISAVVPKVGIDRGLDARKLLDLGRRFGSFDADDLVTHTLPTDRHITGGGADVQVLREREAEPIVNLFRGLPPDAVSPSNIEVVVLNGTGIEGQAADVAGALAEIGFRVVDVDTHDELVGRTTVIYGDGGLAAARRVARHVTGGAALVYDAAASDGVVYLVTGTDLTTLHDQPAPEGSPDDLRSTTTTAAPEPEARPDHTAPEPDDVDDPTTTTTVLGYATGEPPPGIDC
jgi:polyisoprenyl-teichoic acid--peptidoglycan teichoic acid transferase